MMMDLSQRSHLYAVSAVLVWCMIAAVVANAQVPFAFRSVQLQAENVNYGKMVYADVDGDGDMDILAAGNGSSRVPYRAASFVALAGDVVPISLSNPDPIQLFEVRSLPGTALWSADAHWLDYNRDGILDVIITGTTHTAAPYEVRPFEGNTRLFRGTGAGVFQEVQTPFPGVYGGSIAVGDFDNDGDEDIFLSGLRDPATPFSRLYRNNGGSFHRVNTSIASLALGESKWVDVDGDGDLDLLHSGVNASNAIHSILYRNDGNGKLRGESDIFPALIFGRSSWGDYDSDGNLDVVLSGAVLDQLTLLIPQTMLYRNNGSGFELRSDVILPNVFYGSHGWSDYDNDGDMDLMISGATNMGGGRVARIYRQENEIFHERIWLPGVSTGSAVWADFDGNEVVDLLLSGSNISLQPLSRLYENTIRAANTPPSPPGNLQSTVGPGTVSLSWGSGADIQTAEDGLMYNLRIGTQPGRGDIMSAYANASNGARYLPGAGNVWQARSRTLYLPTGTYYWSVQSVDQAYSGSEFAAEASFEITQSKDDVLTSATSGTTLHTELTPGYPNPFTETATIEYSLGEAGGVRIDVYNMLGQRVRTLVAEERPAGSHRVLWPGRGDHGTRVASGVYFVRMMANGLEQTERLVLVQ